MMLVINDTDDNRNQNHHSISSSPKPFIHPKNQKSTNIAIETEIKEPLPILRRILIVDDEPDIALTFKASLDGHCYYHNNDRLQFEVYTFNDPLEALLDFKPHFYDLMLVDVYMPRMNGLELSQKIVEIDPNIRVCCMSAADVNIDGLREVYPRVSFGCFIKKPVSIEFLVKKLLAEIDW